MLARWVGVCILALPLGGAARAEGLPKVLHTATAIRDGVEVRSGPSDSPHFYPTNRLRRGDRVEVVAKVQGGDWLAIKPPPGSFSWIDAKLVRRTGQQTWVVLGEQVPVLIGSKFLGAPPTVEGTRLRRGHILFSQGDTELAGTARLMAIVSPPSERRYVRAADVSPAQDTVARAPGGTPSPAKSAPAPAGGSPESTDPRWLRARAAEEAGRRDEAIRLYRQLGTEARNTDNDLALRALNRAEWLARGSSPLAPRAGTRSRSERATISPAGRTAIATAAKRERPRAAPMPAHQASEVLKTSEASRGWTSSGPGRLMRAGRCLDYQMAYVLENSRGIPVLYATAPPGYSLDSYVGKNVELLGVVGRRDDLRARHMTVMQVRLLP